MADPKNSDTNSQSVKVAFGVEALVERLRNEGVGSGRAEAEKIVNVAPEPMPRRSWRKPSKKPMKLLTELGTVLCT